MHLKNINAKSINKLQHSNLPPTKQTPYDIPHTRQKHSTDDDCHSPKKTKTQTTKNKHTRIPIRNMVTRLQERNPAVIKVKIQVLCHGKQQTTTKTQPQRPTSERNLQAQKPPPPTPYRLAAIGQWDCLYLGGGVGNSSLQSSPINYWKTPVGPTWSSHRSIPYDNSHAYIPPSRTPYPIGGVGGVGESMGIRQVFLHACVWRFFWFRKINDLGLLGSGEGLHLES